jgi:hypothetical protein
VEWDDASNTKAIDATLPAAGLTNFYLIRVENNCPGGAIANYNMGKRSDGTAHVGKVCP